MVSAGVPFGRVIEKRASRALLDGVDYVDREIRRCREAFPVGSCVLLRAGIHDLASGNFADELSEWRVGVCLVVDWLHLFRTRNEACFMAASPELIDGLVLQVL